MIDTEYGPAHVLGSAYLVDGTPGLLVVFRQADFVGRAWPWKGSFMFKVIKQ